MKIQFTIFDEASANEACEITKAIHTLFAPVKQSGAAPLPPSGAAPYFVAAEPLPIAPVAPTVSQPVPTIAPAPLAPPTAPPPPPAAPSVAVAPVSTHAVPVDKHGVPWDERIHAGNRATVADGSWRKRKNLMPGFFEQVMAELQTHMGLPVTPVTPTAQDGPIVGEPDAAAVFGGNVAPAPAAPVAPAPAAPVAAPAAPVVSGLSPHTQLIIDAAKSVNAGRVTKEQIVAACQAFGTSELMALKDNPDAIAAVRVMLGGLV